MEVCSVYQMKDAAGMKLPNRIISGNIYQFQSSEADQNDTNKHSKQRNINKGSPTGWTLLQTSPAFLDGVAGDVLEVDNGSDAEGAVPDEVVVVGGEHGQLRVDAIREQHAEAL
jgi:hypothetical protein